MTKVNLKNLLKDTTVYYIPQHLPKLLANVEKGVVSTIRDGRVWVRYRGPQGNLTPLDCLYV